MGKGGGAGGMTPYLRYKIIEWLIKGCMTPKFSQVVYLPRACQWWGESRTYGFKVVQGDPAWPDMTDGNLR